MIQIRAPKMANCASGSPEVSDPNALPEDHASSLPDTKMDVVDLVIEGQPPRYTIFRAVLRARLMAMLGWKPTLVEAAATLRLLVQV